MLVSQTVPNLVNGVSQQPYALRLSSQGDLQENCLSSVVDGLGRRPPSRHIKRLQTGQITNPFIYTITRDATERYKVIITNGDLKVYDFSGNAMTVNFPNGKGYLSSVNPAKDFSAVTISDYTFLVNRRTKVAMKSDLSPTRKNEGLLFIKQASYVTTYIATVDALSVCVATGDGSTLTGAVSVSDVAKGLVAGMKNSGWSVTQGSTSQSFIAVKAGATISSTSGNVSVAGSPGYYEITVTGAGDASISSTSGGATCLVRNLGIRDVSTSLIAQTIGAAINSYLWSYITTKVEHSVIWMARPGGGTSTYTIEDSRGNTHTTAICGQTQKFSDLPTVGVRDFTVEVTGDQSSTFDNYYVQFSPNNAAMEFDVGVWKETVKPGIPYKLDPATMPYGLVREADGSFTFKQLTWDDRKCGDARSNPDPSFVGNTINDLCFYRNRLVALTQDNAIFTETSQFFNWFTTTATTAVDSDKIDTAASTTKAANLYYGIPFDEGLIFFSDKNQFKLEHQEVFSGKTSAILPLTNFECSPYCRPAATGKTVYFIVNKENHSGVREFFVDFKTATHDAADVTGHVPNYVPANVTKLAAATNVDFVIALSSDDPTALYVYKYLWEGQNKLQSAWSRWTFTGEVLDMEFAESTLYLVMQYSDGVYLEKMNLESGVVDTGETITFYMDRRVTEVGMTTTFDGNSSTLTFPYPILDPFIVTRTGANTRPGEVATILSHSGTQVVVAGDWTNKPLYAGEHCLSRYVFSKQVVKQETKNGGQAAVGGGRLQMRRWVITYAGTGSFVVDVTPEFRDTSLYAFTGRAVGKSIIGQIPVEDGQFSFPAIGKAEALKIGVSSDSYLPFHLLSVDWEGFYTTRSKRF